MGDALAVALLERKGFSAQDFRVLHPGGKLRNSLLRVADLMHEGDAACVGACNAGRDPRHVRKTVGCVGVVGGVLIGIVTDGDLRRTLEEDLLSLSVGDVMTNAPKR